ncbi:MAG: hypothetical protein QW735_01400 [archaeon]
MFAKSKSFAFFTFDSLIFLMLLILIISSIPKEEKMDNFDVLLYEIAQDAVQTCLYLDEFNEECLKVLKKIDKNINYCFCEHEGIKFKRYTSEGEKVLVVWYSIPKRNDAFFN